MRERGRERWRQRGSRTLKRRLAVTVATAERNFLHDRLHIF